MKKTSYSLTLLLAALIIQSCSRGTPVKNPDAGDLAHKIVVADANLTYSPAENREDENKKALFNAGKANDGGLNAAFMDLHVPAGVRGENAYRKVDSLINHILEFTTHHSHNFALAISPDEVEENKKKGLISICMGLNNSAAIGQNLQHIQALYQKGVRYMAIGTTDSSANSGFSQKQVVQRMNEVGMMIDVSGLSDSTFSKVLKMSKAPVIASHASVRYFTPSFKKNLSDEMMHQLAKNDGVMMINFNSNFISDSSRATADSLKANFHQWLQDNKVDSTSKKAQDHLSEMRFEKYHRASIADVADHIDYAVNLMGIDHVGLGSTFGDTPQTFPSKLQNVSDYPNLIKELIHRGYKTHDIRKICYGNLQRVWNRVEAIGNMQSGKQ